jgi:flagellum-specific peptidoglycan hydrolase FlgJ
MATAAQQAAYLQAILPHAHTAAAKLGVSAMYAPLIWAWWSWETDFGTNQSSKANNHAGIKKNSNGSQFDAGQYAGYHSITAFANDWVRILSLGAYGYPEIVAAMRAGKSYEEVTRLHNASSWSEADYNVATIVQRAKVAGGSSPASSGLPDVSNLSADDMKKYATIGLAFAAVVAMLK